MSTRTRLAPRYPEYWAQATQELALSDAVMAELIGRYPASVLSSRGQPFYTLIRSVVGQQISVRAADSIWGGWLHCARA